MIAGENDEQKDKSPPGVPATNVQGGFAAPAKKQESTVRAGASGASEPASGNVLALEIAKKNAGQGHPGGQQGVVDAERKAARMQAGGQGSKNQGQDRKPGLIPRDETADPDDAVDRDAGKATPANRPAVLAEQANPGKRDILPDAAVRSSQPESDRKKEEFGQGNRTDAAPNPRKTGGFEERRQGSQPGTGGRGEANGVGSQLGSPGSQVIVGRQGWLFLQSQCDVLKQHLGKRLLSDAEMATWIQTINTRAEFLKGVGSIGALLISPNPHTICLDMLPEKFPLAEMRPAIQLLNRIQSDFNCCFPVDELRRGHQEGQGPYWKGGPTGPRLAHFWRIAHCSHRFRPASPAIGRGCSNGVMSNWERSR